MITTMLQGGLGNQMFQYAMGYATARRLGVELQLDLSRLGGNPHRIFNLDLFQLNGEKIVYGSTPTVGERSFAYDPTLTAKGTITDGDVLCGYWQCEDYFIEYAPEIFRAFRMKHSLPQLFTPHAISQIEKAGAASTFLGIRRGDYIAKQNYHGVLPVDYYREALGYIAGTTAITPEVFVFSDDPEWCKTELYLQYPFEVLGSFEPTVGNLMGREDVDMYLMSLCRHAVIANSSFHWWGAWLGDFGIKTRRIVAPLQWFTEKSVDSSTVIPKRWIRL